MTSTTYSDKPTDIQIELSTNEDLPPPITPLTWLAFLLGRRTAILAVASSRQSLWLGLLFVLSAGLAREYDGAYLLRESWHLVLPLVASLGTSALLFTLVRLAARAHKLRTLTWIEGYRVVLAFFWMTAPLAWLYAIPVERYLDPTEAMQANLAFLGIVSAWRVVLLIRAITVWLDAPVISITWLVLFFALSVAIALAFVTPTPIWDVMGGVRLAPSEQLILDLKLTLYFIGIPLWILLAIGTAVVGCRQSPPWKVLAVPSSAGPYVSRFAWAFAVSLILGGVSILPLTQPEQARRWEANQLLRSGSIEEALEFIAAQGREAFPRHWSPAPNVVYGEHTPPITDVLAQLDAAQTPIWLRDVFAEKAVLGYELSDIIEAAGNGQTAALTEVLDYLDRHPQSFSDHQHRVFNNASESTKLGENLRNRIRSKIKSER